MVAVGAKVTQSILERTAPTLTPHPLPQDRITQILLTKLIPESILTIQESPAMRLWEAPQLVVLVVVVMLMQELSF